MTAWTTAPEPSGSPVALDLWRTYYTELSDRYYLLHEGRRTDPTELERGIAEDSGPPLVPPTGLLLVGWYDGTPGGTAGIRMADATTAELTRVFIREGLRGKGGSTVLLTAVENAARALGARRMILDTRHDLVEARALYARHGYEETERHNHSQYAEHWFRKELLKTT
ncbi:GNAT family N-acetyltransferase [Streptomyces tsukubensis]|uniref:GNAT family N-acetyltransferase n=1 Tax=Streptomyces tsukubensis TaxID=83656 RepID=A0A1V4A5I8_9ACTN|nr:GNAT family N-acetyltransferase [Streptomyces tsukubensis]OON76692.1 GNAT family N-acetyltransferase [Streptomyces tsukubensis]QFR93339.1 GNAT family N-acetyltransferase [Streptomyces tsukubensis]